MGFADRIVHDCLVYPTDDTLPAQLNLWAESIHFVFLVYFLRLSVTASLIRQSIFFIASFLADRRGSAVEGLEYLRPLEHWDRGFESHSRHVRTGFSKSRFTETVHRLTVIIFTCVQIFIAAGGNTVVTLSLSLHLVLNKVIFLWNVRIISVKRLLGHSLCLPVSLPLRFPV
jgi:hypothetical protein